MSSVSVCHRDTSIDTHRQLKIRSPKYTELSLFNNKTGEILTYLDILLYGFLLIRLMTSFHSTVPLV